MTRDEALLFSKNNLVPIKIDWWADYMYIYFCPVQKKYLSGGNEAINLEFLSPGVYEVLENKDKHLGGLFSL